ncbi:MAG: SusC/RagA family TonB-linked outer membrane protein [Prolixibacteraceae bacterium]|nr:SusC/RagA family TonB-linked outer membrane protein [Prolixibacteraceae bacterium]
MRYHNIYLKYRTFGIMLLCILLAGSLSAQDKKSAKKVKLINVTLKVTDENGRAFPKAQVIVGEGVIHADTDEKGTFSYKGYPDDFVTVIANGYEKSVALAEDLAKNGSVKLMKSKLQMTDDDLVPLPFFEMKKRETTGSSDILSTNQLERYPSTDFRNALTGLGTGVEIREMNGSPGISAEEFTSRNGFSAKFSIAARQMNMMFIIDDVPTDITEMPLDPNEVESVTIVKDIADKAMFGPSAANGIVFVKTKRGKTNERVLNANVEYGTSVVDRFPGWVNGSEYATLNNLARTNEGLTPRYLDTDVAAYSKNDPYDYYHPSVDFRSMMLKNSKSYTRINLSSSGGNDRVQYFAYLGYNGEGDIYKIGPTADYNRLNARSNIDIKINDFIKVQFNFFGGLSFRRSSNYGYNSNYTNQDAGTNTVLTGIEFPTVLNDITSIPPVAFPVYASPFDPTSGNPPYFGVSSNFTQNPIGNLTANGYYTESGRTGAATTALEFDMRSILPGLKSKSYLAFDAFNQLRVGKAQDYYAYIATPSKTAAGTDTILLAKKHDGTQMDGQVLLNEYYYQQMAVYENLSYAKKWNKNDLQLSATYFISKIARSKTEEPQRLQNGVLTGKYSWNDKFIFNGVLNYGGTSAFDRGHRYKFFPSGGFAWVVSEEKFMKNIKSIDYLKLRVQGGMLGYESFLAPFSYRDRWNNNNNGTLFGPASTNQWFGNTTETLVYRVSPNRTGNPNITWELRKEFSAGIDGLFFGEKLALELTYYNNLRDGVISQVSSRVPNIAGVSSALPRFNFNKYRFTGLEFGIQYTDKFGKFEYSLGGNGAMQNSKVEKYDEPQYRNAYQIRTGTALDLIFGQTYIGKFATDADALVVPQLYDQTLHAGDLKYKDNNGDGFIDDSDASPIGHGTPRLFYSVNLKLDYKGFELYVMGTGRAFYDITLTNQYYWNGWGDNTYSTFVRDNIGGAYPRLTYNKVNNNFVGSNFWLVKGGFFKIQNVELSYTLPGNSLKVIGARGTKFFVRGANLLTISKIKDVDPESINSGVETYPLFKTFAAGIKLTF